MIADSTQIIVLRVSNARALFATASQMINAKRRQSIALSWNKNSIGGE